MLSVDAFMHMTSTPKALQIIRHITHSIRPQRKNPAQPTLSATVWVAMNAISRADEIKIHQLRSGLTRIVKVFVSTFTSQRFGNPRPLSVSSSR